MVWCRAVGGRDGHGARLWPRPHARGAGRVPRAKGWTSFFYGGRDGVRRAARRAHDRALPGSRRRRHLLAALPAAHGRRGRGCGRASSVAAARPDLGRASARPSRSGGWPSTSTVSTRGSCSGSARRSTSTQGLLRQAPPWMQRLGLEWLFRLIVEPRRLWKRYLSNNPRFVWDRASTSAPGRGRGSPRVRRIDSRAECRRRCGSQRAAGSSMTYATGSTAETFSRPRVGGRRRVPPWAVVTPAVGARR